MSFFTILQFQTMNFKSFDYYVTIIEFFLNNYIQCSFTEIFNLSFKLCIIIDIYVIILLILIPWNSCKK